jgi:hypothetical protein
MDLTRQDLQMAMKKQKAKKSQPAKSRSPTAMIGTVFNMTVTLAAFGSVLLYLIVAKHFT